MNSAVLLLTVAFPVSQGYKGAATTIRDLARHGLYSGHLGTTPCKREAVRLIVLANMERAEAFGQGSKARRKEDRLPSPMTRWVPSLKSNPSDLAHDERTEGYARRHFRTNPHD